LTASDQPGLPSEFVFFFPYRPVSGVPMLFARIARALDARGYRCAVIDYPDGCLSSQVASTPGIRRVAFTDGVPVTADAGALIIMQAMLPATLWDELQPAAGARILFWSLYAMNYVQVAVPLDWARDWQTRSMRVQRVLNRTALRAFQRRLGGFVRTLVERGSLVFMDGTTWQAAAERLEIPLPRARFVPVVVEMPEQNPRTAVPEGALTVTWLGRLDDFKIHILNHLVRTLDAVATAQATPITLEIIGDGPLADQLVSPGAGLLTLARRGTLIGAPLTEVLNRSHLHVAMGTSALEGARLGVPTVLVDFAYGPVPADYRFRWLTDAVDFELGRQIDASCRGGDSVASLQRVLAEVQADALRRSREAYDYCQARHSVDAGVDAFLAAAQTAAFRYRDIDPAVRRKGVVRRLYERLRGRTPAAAAMAR